MLGFAIGIKNITKIEEYTRTYRALILDERQREQHFRTTLDQYVAAEGIIAVVVGIHPVDQDLFAIGAIAAYHTRPVDRRSTAYVDVLILDYIDDIAVGIVNRDVLDPVSLGRRTLGAERVALVTAHRASRPGIKRPHRTAVRWSPQPPP